MKIKHFAILLFLIVISGCLSSKYEEIELSGRYKATYIGQYINDVLTSEKYKDATYTVMSHDINTRVFMFDMTAVHGKAIYFRSHVFLVNI